MSVSPAQNFSKPPPVPGCADRDAHVGVLGLEFFGCRLGERPDGAGAVDTDGTGDAFSASTTPAAAVAAVFVVATSGRAKGEDAARGEREELPHAHVSFSGVITAATLTAARHQSVIQLSRLVKKV